MKRIFMAALLLIAAFTPSEAQTTAEATGKVLNAYYSLKNALAADNNSLAKTAAQELLADVTVFPDEQLNAARQKTWNSYQEKLEFDSRHISESPNIAHQREHFERLSKNVAEVLAELKLNTATIYKQYCPMKKAMWLSETSTINNPYFGKQMLTCGKNTGTIAPVK